MGCGAAKEAGVAERPLTPNAGGANHAERIRRERRNEADVRRRGGRNGRGPAGGVLPLGGLGDGGHSGSDDENHREGGGARGSPARRAAVESYWTAGSVASGAGAPPHFVPMKGPWSTLEKLPAPAQQFQGRIIFSVQAEMPPSVLQAASSRARVVTGELESAATDSDAAKGAGAEPHSGGEEKFLALAHPATPPPLRPESLNQVGNADINGGGEAAAGRVLASPRAPPLQRHTRFVPMPIPRLLTSTVSKTNGTVAVGASTTTSAAAALHGEELIVDGRRAHYVARAALPHSLANYSVGWIKLPTSPNTATGAGGTAGGAGTDRGTSSEASAAAAVGYLNPSKPCFDVAVDGSVVDACYFSSSTQRRPRRNSDSDEDGDAERPAQESQRLQKYFLYVESVLQVGITLRLEAPGTGGSLLDATTLAQHHHCSVLYPGRKSDLSKGDERTWHRCIDGAFFTFDVPPLVASTSFFTHVENSVPLYIFSNLAAEHHTWWDLLLQRSSVPAESKNVEELDARIATAVAALSSEQKLWLVFRAHFNGVLAAFLATVGSSDTPDAVQPDKPFNLVRLHFGLCFAYDNHHFVAFNSHSPLQSAVHVAPEPTAVSDHGFLRFVDTSRSPSVGVSEQLCSGCVSLQLPRDNELRLLTEELHGECTMLQLLVTRFFGVPL